MIGHFKPAALCLLATVCMVAASGSAAQEAYPSRPITLVVPYAAGGSTDQLGRALADGLGRMLKQPVVIENKPGGNGTFGVTQMMRVKPDGYNLTMLPLSVFRQPYLQQVSYDPLKDLTYIATVANYSYAIAVRQDAKWKTIKELVEDWMLWLVGSQELCSPGKLFYMWDLDPCTVPWAIAITQAGSRGLRAFEVKGKCGERSCCPGK
ncbi:MAG: hypothetical protein EOO38_26310 [Cytophagaceae bacterium]|nr:MAG: hypothetical protein EOO38_26310 [Cytophagaceae bacterium]